VNRKAAMAAVRANPRDADAWTTLGHVMAMEGERDKARECYQRALALVPDHPAAATGLANLDASSLPLRLQRAEEMPTSPPPHPGAHHNVEAARPAAGRGSSTPGRVKIGFVGLFLALSCMLMFGLLLVLDDSSTGSTSSIFRTQSQTVTTSKGTFTIPGTAYIDGRDEDPSGTLITYSPINVWSKARGLRESRCMLPHGTEVQVTDYWQEDFFRSFYVETPACKGWVNYGFLSPTDHEAVGPIR